MSTSSINQDFPFLASESEAEPMRFSSGSWTVLIVDDDAEIHSVTELALADVHIDNKDLRFLHAYSGEEAKTILAEQPDIALILLDVVMETDDAGLQVVKYIRNELGRHDIRIVLRTGQPGFAPEENIIKDYDINDYKTKTELTRNKLVTSIYSSIRSYQQIKAIQLNQKGLESIINSSMLSQVDSSPKEFAVNVIDELAQLYSVDNNGGLFGIPNELTENPSLNEIHIYGGSGDYAEFDTQPLDSIGIKPATTYVKRCLQQKQSILEENKLCLYISGRRGAAALFLDGNTANIDINSALTQVFINHVAVNFDNLYLFKQLKKTAYQDELTNLPNRQEFIRFASEQIDAGRSSQVAAVIDIDKFADINGGLGSEIGNQLLLAVAQRLAEFAADDCFISRVGADVFGLIGPKEKINPIKLNRLFIPPIELAEQTLPIRVTMGLYEDFSACASGLLLLKQTYIALNLAKKRSQGYFEYYRQEMEEETAWRLAMIRELRQDFEAGRLEVWYQPQLDLNTKTYTGMEALLRWRKQNGEFVSPATFIPLAESSGLIVEIGAWVIEHSCKQLRRLHLLGHTNMRVAVNVSMPQFLQPDFVDVVSAAVMKSHIDPSTLELEITESLMMDEPGEVIETLSRLKMLGITIAVDDFGMGFSSLSYLQRLPIDKLKIDREFVREMEAEGKGVIAEMIIGLANKLGMVSIAEGVECQEQEAYLQRLNCAEVQGFYYAKPMPSQQLEQFLQAPTAGK